MFIIFFDMDTTTSFYDRLMLIKDYLNIKTDRQFAPAIGISYQNFTSYKRGSQPSLNILTNILSTVKGLNPEWLLFGRGAMILEEDNFMQTREPEIYYENRKNEVRITKEEFLEMKKQISELITTNKNLSEVVREKNFPETAGSA